MDYGRSNGMPMPTYAGGSSLRSALHADLPLNHRGDYTEVRSCIHRLDWQRPLHNHLDRGAKTPCAGARG